MKSLQDHVAEAMQHQAHGDLDLAQSIYEQLLCQVKTPDANIFLGYGTLLVAKQMYGLGIMMMNIGLRLYPDHPLGWTNLGVALKHIGKDEESLKAYEKAYALKPDMPEVLASMSGYYINRNMPEKAEGLARRALAIDHSCAGANMNLGVSLLEQGRFEEAWPHYEHRWESLDKVRDKRPYLATRWKGEKVKTLAIHGEQGLGDEILFMAGLAKARERADKIVVECAGRLIRTFEESFGIRCFKDHASLIEECGEPDAYIPMGSLFSVVGLPDGKPYLKRPNVIRTDKPLIGIAWKGGTMKTNHGDRSMDLRDFNPILSSIDAHFISVQYGDDHVDKEAEEFGLITGPRDFDSLQFRIGTCDLVISVLQTAVHQAGAMGVPCWALTPHKHPWVFAGKDESLRWYNSVKLFRQSSDMEWAPVIERVAAELREMNVEIAA